MATAINDPPVEDSSPPISASTAAPLRAQSSSLSLQIPIAKLTEHNYLTWSQFILAVLKSNRALRFVNSSDIPPQFLIDLEQFLLTFESRLHKNKHKSVSDALSANVAAHSSPKSPLSVSMQPPPIHNHHNQFPNYSVSQPPPSQASGGFQSGFYSNSRSGHGGRGGRCGGRGRNSTRQGNYFYAPHNNHNGTLNPAQFYGNNNQNPAPFYGNQHSSGHYGAQFSNAFPNSQDAYGPRPYNTASTHPSSGFSAPGGFSASGGFSSSHPRAPYGGSSVYSHQHQGQKGIA
ncbi:hypothetical protein Lal_00033790 [Lupinus albus]|nr:hypothetical protein Lal_00033790 [Lupinus albus]